MLRSVGNRGILTARMQALRQQPFEMVTLGVAHQEYTSPPSDNTFGLYDGFPFPPERRPGIYIPEPTLPGVDEGAHGLADYSMSPHGSTIDAPFASGDLGVTTGTLTPGSTPRNAKKASIAGIGHGHSPYAMTHRKRNASGYISSTASVTSSPRRPRELSGGLGVGSTLRHASHASTRVTSGDGFLSAPMQDRIFSNVSSVSAFSTGPTTPNQMFTPLPNLPPYDPSMYDPYTQPYLPSTISTGQIPGKPDSTYGQPGLSGLASPSASSYSQSRSVQPSPIMQHVPQPMMYKTGLQSIPEHNNTPDLAMAPLTTPALTYTNDMHGTSTMPQQGQLVTPQTPAQEQLYSQPFYGELNAYTGMPYQAPAPASAIMQRAASYGHQTFMPRPQPFQRTVSGPVMPSSAFPSMQHGIADLSGGLWASQPPTGPPRPTMYNYLYPPTQPMLGQISTAAVQNAPKAVTPGTVKFRVPKASPATPKRKSHPVIGNPLKRGPRAKNTPKKGKKATDDLFIDTSSQATSALGVSVDPLSSAGPSSGPSTGMQPSSASVFDDSPTLGTMRAQQAQAMAQSAFTSAQPVASGSKTNDNQPTLELAPPAKNSKERKAAISAEVITKLFTVFHIPMEQAMQEAEMKQVEEAARKAEKGQMAPAVEDDIEEDEGDGINGTPSAKKGKGKKEKAKLETKRYRCLVENCDRVFPRRSAAYSHVQTHLDDKQHQCDEW